jgi:hypothetical protein
MDNSIIRGRRERGKKRLANGREYLGFTIQCSPYLISLL